MPNLQVHVVTLRVLPVESHGDYLKTHALDANLWEAWFSTSKLDQWDKLKQCFELLPKPLVVEIACVFAESVLPIYESENARDNRPRAAIAAARAWIKNPCQETMDAADASADAASYAANAAYAAASAANAADAAASAAANATNAAYAAASAAYAADAAASAAANAAARAANANAAARAAFYAANAAADAAYAAANTPEFEQNQLKIVIDLIKANSNLLIA